VAERANSALAHAFEELAVRVASGKPDGEAEHADGMLSRLFSAIGVRA